MTVDMSYVMLPAMLHISKYTWLTFHLLFKIFKPFYVSVFLLRPHRVHNFWHTRNGTSTIV